ncbi:MAG: hypothetical protein ABSB32_18400 [Thermodesulfobacteriota bacterium]
MTWVFNTKRYTEAVHSAFWRQSRIFGRPFYIRDADESAKFEKAGAHEEKCPTVVGKGARWVAEILMEEADS